MLSLKNLGALIIAAHGIGFSLWILPSWLGFKVGPGREWIFSGVSITSPIGKLFGLLALILIVGFLATAWGIFTSAAWWAPVGLVAAAVAMAVVILWLPIALARNIRL
jgi:hypothetical protein